MNDLTRDIQDILKMALFIVLAILLYALNFRVIGFIFHKIYSAIALVYRKFRHGFRSASKEDTKDDDVRN